MQNIQQLITVIERRLGSAEIPAESFHVEVRSLNKESYKEDLTARLGVFYDGGDSEPPWGTELLEDKQLGWFDLEVRDEHLYVNGRKVVLVSCGNPNQLDEICSQNEALGFGVARVLSQHGYPREDVFYIPSSWRKQLKGGHGRNVDRDKIIFAASKYRWVYEKTDVSKTEVSIICAELSCYEGAWRVAEFDIRQFDGEGKEIPCRKRFHSPWLQKEERIFVAVLEK